ncbi:hypothetical protein AGMMS49921_00930 [Endomicrobiia bacterium]|nr:hypothetical protein AGMMS49921_00930 [Endomicrobiia bacterium]
MKNFEVLLLDEFGNSVHESMEMEIYKNLLNFYKDKIIVDVPIEQIFLIYLIKKINCKLLSRYK